MRISRWMGAASLAALVAGAFGAPKVAVGAEARRPPPPVREAPAGLSGQDVYQVLMGEIAFRRGQLEVAAQAYADVAARLHDGDLFGRAMQIAVAAQMPELALQVARRWTDLEPKSPAARHGLANALAMLGRREEMMPHLEQLLALDPDGRPRNLLHLSRLFPSGEPAQALEMGRQLAAPYLELPEANYLVGSLARAAGQRDLALASIRRASELRPGWPPAAFLEAQMLGTPAAALEVWNRFLSANGEFEPAFIQRARLLVGEKRYTEARSDYEAALRLKPNSAETAYALGLLSLQLNDRAAAEKYFLRLEGRDFGAAGMIDYQLGVLALERGDRDAAIGHFSGVGKGDYYIRARAQHALLLARANKYDEARRLLADTEATTTDDKSRLALADAHILRESKRLEAALEVIEKALQADRDDGDLLYEKAMLAERLRQMDEVDRTLGRLLELQPNNPHALNALGYSWAERNIRLEEARQLISRALELAPTDPFIMDSLGWVMFRLGKPEIALQHLEEAYRQRPDPEIAAHIGEVLWSMDRRDEARKIWAESRKQFPDNDVLGAVIEKFRP